ncbi:hypothetical protein PYW08_003015 [Mythimna loreyi]|uniref:Uncharacterized protein n=1 Tax=Mythimna loreyi TaxID=667449 RepID=A0ACC2QV50_9NEOP|nr:hypothetical protein PYW08_003015 [Mythimna loreyi]
MTKCDICNKGITNRSPGLECRSCAKTVHASKTCSGLTAKQLSALRNADSLDWKCEECTQNSPHRKSSFFVPDEEDEEEEGASRFLKDITTELKKVLKKELQPIELSISLCGKKVDDLTKTVEAQNGHIQELEKKYTHLSNEKTHLELEMSSLKQHLRSIEQQQLDNTVEVIGIPKAEEEDLNTMSVKLAETLNVDKSQIIRVERLYNRNDREGNIHVQLKRADQARAWVQASRKKEILLEKIVPEVTVEKAKTKVSLRRALTKANKSLLWLAQQKLRPPYKYIWFQDGKVLLRKEDRDKPTVVRSETDIEKLTTSTQAGGQNSYR